MPPLSFKCSLKRLALKLFSFYRKSNVSRIQIRLDYWLCKSLTIAYFRLMSLWTLIWYNIKYHAKALVFSLNAYIQPTAMVTSSLSLERRLAAVSGLSTMHANLPSGLYYLWHVLTIPQL
jgi:hypothetical protein